jgi:hypothetical protein
MQRHHLNAGLIDKLGVGVEPSILERRFTEMRPRVGRGSKAVERRAILAGANAPATHVLNATNATLRSSRAQRNTLGRRSLAWCAQGPPGSPLSRGFENLGVNISRSARGRASLLGNPTFKPQAYDVVAAASTQDGRFSEDAGHSSREAAESAVPMRPTGCRALPSVKHGGG